MAEYLRKSGDKYIWTGGYDTRDVPKKAGFRWNPDDRYWWTTFRDTAAKLADYAVSDLKADLKGFAAKKSESITASKAASSDADIPAPAGLDYLPFQKAGIQYAAQRQNVLFGDEMGLGKTIQAIGTINVSPDVKKILVVAPASLKLNWKRELEKWLIRPASVGIANGSFPDTDIVVANYDILKKHRDSIDSRTWDMVIADEAHYLKNPDAQRTKLFLGGEVKDKQTGKYIHQAGIVDRIKKRAFLTGTPILNRPIELWPIAHALAPETFPSFMSFAKRYADAQQNRYGWDFSGASNLDELQEKLRSTVMVRRLKKDVLSELPPKRRQVVEIYAGGGNIKAIEKEKAAIRKHEATLVALRTQVELAKASDDDEDYAIAVRNLREAAQVAFTEMSKVRHDVAVAKIPDVVAFLKDALETEDKLVVFAHHHDVIDAIQKEFPDSVKLTGEESIEERQRAVDAFQTDPKARLFIGSMKAAGAGITLTAASHVIFAELDWVPGNVTQAEDRLHRIGQKDSVLVQHLVLDGSLDSEMAKTLVDKQNIIDSALDIEPAPPTPLKEPATGRTGRKALAAIPALSDIEVGQVRTGLRFLAGVDDGAVARDNAGFNKIDTGIGNALARLDKLTQKQAALGLVLLRKYRGQLETASLPIPNPTAPTAEKKAETTTRESEKTTEEVVVTAPPSKTETAKTEPFEIVLSVFDEKWKEKAKQVSHNAAKEKFKVSFPYDADLVAAVKTVPGVRFNRDTKNWDLPDALADVAAVKKLIQFAEKTGFVFSAGARDTAKEIVESAGGSLRISVAEQSGEKKETVASKKDSDSFWIGRGEGYGGTEYKVGSVIRVDDKRSPYQGFVRVVESKKEYYREDGLSFGVGDDRGYYFSARVTPAIAEEAAPLIAKEKTREQARALAATLRLIKQGIQAQGIRPNDEQPVGDRLFDTQTIYGGGDWFVVGDKGVWYVQNNGADGDNWSGNNVRTGGAGAIGWKVEAVPELTTKLQGLATALESLKSGTTLSDSEFSSLRSEIPATAFVAPYLASTTSKTSRETLLVELQRAHAQRSDAARLLDETLSNKNTVELDDWSGVATWGDHPGRADIVGVDTPKKPRYIKRRTKKKRETMETSLGSLRK